DVQPLGVPIIHFGTNTATLLEDIRYLGVAVIGIDWRVPLNEAWRKVGFDRALQGNLDPLVLCAPREVIHRRVRALIDEAGGRPGHIFNLGHGIVPETPVENVQAAIEIVHSTPRIYDEPTTS